MEPVGNTDPQLHVEAATKRDEIEVAQARADLMAVLDTEGGRRFAWRLLARCKVYQTTMTGNSWTYFNEGVRHVGLELLDEITELDPHVWIRMQEEAHAWERRMAQHEREAVKSGVEEEGIDTEMES